MCIWLWCFDFSMLVHRSILVVVVSTSKIIIKNGICIIIRKIIKNIKGFEYNNNKKVVLRVSYTSNSIIVRS